jgi:hypothetical protein
VSIRVLIRTTFNEAWVEIRNVYIRGLTRSITNLAGMNWPSLALNLNHEAGV